MSSTVPACPGRALQQFAERWGVISVALFESVLREDPSAESDIDVLISFRPDSQADLFDLIEMKHELQHLFGGQVDLVEKEALVNPYRKKEILTNHRTIYTA